MDNVKFFEQLNVDIGLATEKDIIEIIRLQQENLAPNVSGKEKQEQGFVSVETSEQLLKEIIKQEGIVVARLEGKVVGYLIPMSVEHTVQQVSMLDPFIEKLQTLTFDDKPLKDYKYCILTQVCVDKKYRGRGILEKLYGELKTKLSDKYELGVSEISSNNPRSLHVHLNKIGLKVAEQYSAEGKDWHIVILDFRNQNK
ncbi:MAG: GNAT family N-acetyltransferase [Minisyncoccia bacterium]